MHLKGLLFLSFLFYFIPTSSFGQVDSLKKMVQSLPEGEEKVDVYKNIAFHYYYENPDLCLKYCDTMEQLSLAIDFPKGLSKANYLRSTAYYTKGDYLIALDFAEKSITGMLEVGDSLGVAIGYGMLGSIYINMSILDKAAESLILSAEMSERIDDSLGVAISHQNLGNVFLQLSDFETAKSYYLKAIPIYEEYEWDGYLANTYNALSTVEKTADRKRYWLEKALETGGDMPEYLAAIYANWASYYFNEEQQPMKAIQFGLSSLKMAEQSGDLQQMVENYTSLGSYYEAIGLADSAIYYLHLGAIKAKEHDIKVEEEDAYYFLYEHYKNQNNPSKALEYMELAYILKDTIHGRRITEQIQTNAAKFELEKKERILAEQRLQIAEQKAQRNQIILFALLALALIAGWYQYYLYRQQRKKRQTELALAQEQAETQKLRELDQLKSDFFTNISHELRTPLTLILAPVTDVLDNPKSNNLKNQLQLVASNAKGLLNLVNEIMDLAKMQAGQLKLMPKKTLLEPLVRRLFFAFESLAGIRNLEYKLQYEIQQSIQVDMDVEKFEKILNNLLSNAIKYTSTGGKVHLKVTETSKGFSFAVMDTGTGIHPDDQPHVFRRFYQAKNEKMVLKGGTGVGLALAKELAQLFGGDLTFTSEWGRGSTFILNLPLEKTYLQEEQLEKLVVPTTKVTTFNLPTFQPLFINNDKPKLLIVEDNPEMSRYLEQNLSEHYHCTTAMDGKAALKKLKLFDFHCITSDVMMPNMDGFEFREKVNEHPQWRQIPFLLLTARHLEEDKLKGFQLGIDDYVTKPFSTKELQARIHNLIRNKIERDEFLKTEKSLTAAHEAVEQSVEQQLLQKAETIVLENIDKTDFKVADLAREIGYSPKQLGRIIKKLTGLSSVAFILEIRLQKARLLLEKRAFGTVTEVMFEVGIQSTSYFTRKFTERFGKNPSEVLG